MQDLLLSLSRKDMKANMRKYEKKAPKPLNSLFQEKLAKSEAVSKFKEKKKKGKTSLFPPGTLAQRSLFKI